jgi:serine/threonine protein kinase
MICNCFIFLLQVAVASVYALSECKMSQFLIRETEFDGGGQSTLQLLQHRQSGKLYVLKEYNTKKGYLTELTILTSINHPHIIKPVCHLGKSKQILFPHYAKGSLKQIPEGTSQARLAIIAAQAISTLIYLHGQGYTHHDVKPGNILLDDSLNVIFIDFGLSCEVGRERTGTGTRYAMAPEVGKGARYLSGGPHFHRPSPAIDWWSLGVTLWMVNEMVLVDVDDERGRSFKKIGPFAYCKSKRETVVVGHDGKIKYRPFPAHFSRELVQLLTYLLQPKPEMRTYYSKMALELSYFRGVRNALRYE